MNALTQISEIEAQVLALWACSQTVKESARYLDLSVRTIDYYRSKLKCKFNMDSSNQVINNLIHMDDYEHFIRLGKNILVNATKYGSREISRQF